MASTSGLPVASGKTAKVERPAALKSRAADTRKGAGTHRDMRGPSEIKRSEAKLRQELDELISWAESKEAELKSVKSHMQKEVSSAKVESMLRPRATPRHRRHLTPMHAFVEKISRSHRTG